VRARLSRAGLDLAYLTIGGATAVLAFCVWVTAVSVTLSLLVFVIGLPVFLLAALVFRWTAELDRRNAALALGAPLRGSYDDHSGGFFTRLSRTAGDMQTWKDLAWLVVHSFVGFLFATVAIGLVAQAVGVLFLPAWYWSIEGGPDVGVWHIDTVGKAFAVAPLAIPLAAIAVLALRGMTIAESALATLLLGPGSAAAKTGEGARRGGGTVMGRAWQAPEPQALLIGQAALSALVAVVVCVIWLATGGGWFWPGPVLLGLAIGLGLHLGLREALRAPRTLRALATQGALSAVAVAIAVAIWAFTGGPFWPLWVILGLLLGIALHLLVAAMWRQVFPDPRERELSERVDELTRTRRGAIDVQNAELRRIERDLHDGAQARLVALSMQLGRAEERLGSDPETAALLRAARGEAGAAIAELRDLARGIAPPVLADRGLAAAVAALGRRAAIPVSVEVVLGERPAAAIESAAYFVVAEALTNVAKHAPEAEAAVAIGRAGDVLVVEVVDNGPGGADPAGSGLAGLRGRVEALDGELTVTSPPGGGTTIRAELPCGS
jgi:signal transduction histidine kinase